MVQTKEIKLISDSKKELMVIVSENGEINLDWTKIETGNFSVNSILLQQEFAKNFKEDKFISILHLGMVEKSLKLPNSIMFLKSCAKIFVDKLTMVAGIEFLREKVILIPEKEDIKKIFDSVPYMIGSEYINEEWIYDFWSGLNKAFAQEIEYYKGTVEEYFLEYSSKLHTKGRVFFHLVESKIEDYPFAFLATYSTEKNIGKSGHIPLKNALLEYSNDEGMLISLLATVNKATEKSDFIRSIVDTGEIFHPLKLTINEAYNFLKEIPIYDEAGILCRIPNWWKNKSNSLKLSIKVGENEKKYLGFDALVDFDAQILLAGESMTIEELKKIADNMEGLALIKGKWVEVDSEKLKNTIEAYERAKILMDENDMSIIEAMKFQLNFGKNLNIDDKSCEIEVLNGQWLESVVRNLKNPGNLTELDCGKEFNASLREYQEKGLNWLGFMKKLKLGACLADDMGLGKTIQVIALLNYIKTQANEKTLLVIPTSLISNWINEINKFAPMIKYFIVHSSENKVDKESFKESLENNELFITTYKMISKLDYLVEYTWDNLILDEAQAIKNPNTKQTKAIKKLKANYRIALTGTPIENRLTDLWSLFDFLNKGLLGSPKEFKGFTNQLKENQKGYAKLKQVISPFILRRLKTDRTIISDLPEKIEMKTYADLTKKQIALYNSLVIELKDKLDSTDEGIKRKGLVLASLAKFKQICNHPSQYLGQPAFDEKDSGKFERLKEICEIIYEKREKVIIFTQFKEMTEPIKEYLCNIFEHEGLVLHGSTSIKNRKEIVERFQSNEYVPFLVLSIKAGGVGLNLTSANHVIHFDRWWNPAVENQATDRAFRIGQKKNVIVHKFITKGTIEEKIDKMIDDKLKISTEIIADTNESWLTEMDNNQLMSLFKLSV